jgi:hypothetical protein
MRKDPEYMKRNPMGASRHSSTATSCCSKRRPFVYISPTASGSAARTGRPDRRTGALAGSCFDEHHPAGLSRVLLSGAIYNWQPRDRNGRQRV